MGEKCICQQERKKERKKENRDRSKTWNGRKKHQKKIPIMNLKKKWYVVRGNVNDKWSFE